ncbi:MAG: sigma-54 dependent transcriptional regulator [Puniceicoccales bacterium]|jgi:DNA-binding NtrC family response regulator|nr:sigma-54 dependent transcriptional regulator [Puniceicoccales bacterium]
MKRLLIVDDERHAREGLAAAMGGSYSVAMASSAAEAMAQLQNAGQPFDLLLTDLRMPGRSGLDIVAFCRTLPNPPACILMTAYGDIPTAVQAMRAGAVDFLSKPLNLDAVEAALARAMAGRSTATDGKILGQSPAMGRVLGLVERVARSDATVLIMGETGTGKELIAREIHGRSGRARGPFLAINGAALPREMVESALFGHERGAFTDANRRHIGYLERAAGGTLLLDEVGELPIETQVKLLRVLENRSYERLGGSETLAMDVRILAATNRDLRNAMENGTFRSDLFYRLNVVPLTLPPLRERREDIPILLDHFFHAHANPPTLAPATLAILCSYDWPGNVRELRNFCDSQSVLRAGERIFPNQLDSRFCQPLADGKDAICHALAEAGGNRSRAAKLLGLGRSTLYRRLRQGMGEKSCHGTTPR